MGVSKLGVLMGVAITLGLASIVDVSANPLPGPIVEIDMRVPHGMIDIGSNVDFTEENGVSRGAGTVGNPYVIQNWTITIYNGDTGVSIHNTDAFFVLRNVEVRHSDDDGIGYRDIRGIDVEDSSNGRVEYCIIKATECGIRLYDSQDIHVSRNSIDGTREGYSSGILVTSCVNADLTKNDLEMWGYGISVRGSSDGRIEENTIRSTTIGINLIDCSGVLIGANEIDSTSADYSDNSWSDNTWLMSQSTTNSDVGLLLLVGVVVPVDAALLILGFVRLRRHSHAS